MGEAARIQRELLEVRAEVGSLLARLDRLEGELVAIRAPAVGSTSLLGNSPTGTDSSAGTLRRVTAADYTRGEREEAARVTGRFFARCLSGAARGESGRARIRLANRIFVVVKDFSGLVTTDPVRVFSAWTPVKRLVAEEGNGHNFGDSIFAGFASRWEAELAIQEAGFLWPASIQEN